MYRGLRRSFRGRNNLSSRGKFATVAGPWRRISWKAGPKRNSAAEFKRHLIIAIGECAETKFWIDLATDEGFIEAKRAGLLGSEYGKLGFMLHNLWKEWRKF